MTGRRRVHPTVEPVERTAIAIPTRRFHCMEFGLPLRGRRSGSRTDDARNPRTRRIPRKASDERDAVRCPVTTCQFLLTLRLLTLRDSCPALPRPALGPAKESEERSQTHATSPGDPPPVTTAS